MSIECGEWYIMRLMVHSGRMIAFVNGSEIYDSNSGFPVTSYGEPHLAVRYTVAVFEYMRILTISYLAKHALDNWVWKF